MTRNVEEASLNGAITLAVSAMKGMFLVNAGGVLAGMTYIGNIQPRYDILLEITFSLKLFIIGLILSVVTSLLAYGVQNLQTGRVGADYFAAECLREWRHALEVDHKENAQHFESQYREYLGNSDSIYRKERILMWLAPIMGLFSLSSFSIGAWLAANALSM